MSWGRFSTIAFFVFFLFSLLASANSGAPSRGLLLIDLARTHSEIEEKETLGIQHESAAKELRRKRFSLECKLILLGGPTQDSTSLKAVTDVPGLLVTPDTLKMLQLDETGSYTLQDLVLANRNAPKTLDDELPIQESEFVASRKYAIWIHGTAGENLLLLPSYQRRSVAGFDGVVYDRDRKPIANYSTKSVVDQSLEGAINIAIEKADFFSHLHNWSPWSPKSPYSSPIHPGIPRASKKERSKQLGQAFVQSIAWLKDLWSYLGLQIWDSNGKLTPPRPYRVVIEVTDQNSMAKRWPAYFKEVRERIENSRGKIDSITIIFGNQAAVITAKDIQLVNIT